jgi:hypothetical protein
MENSYYLDYAPVDYERTELIKVVLQNYDEPDTFVTLTLRLTLSTLILIFSSGLILRSQRVSQIIVYVAIAICLSVLLSVLPSLLDVEQLVLASFILFILVLSILKTSTHKHRKSFQQSPSYQPRKSTFLSKIFDDLQAFLS